MLRAAPQRVERAAMCPGQEQSKIVAAPPVHDGDDKTFVGLGARQGAQHVARVHFGVRLLPFPPQAQPCRDPQACGYPSRA